jgi:hypothetical protein
MTDCHITTDMHAPDGFAKCLHHMQNLPEPPQLILNGGDSIFDAFSQMSEAVKPQWRQFHSTFKQNCSLPIEHVIGNHDIWGWDVRNDVNSSTAALAGKSWAMDELGLTNRYRSFDKAGWHFIMLDSIQQTKRGAQYVAKFDEEQHQWLEQDLARTLSTTPILVLSHCPIFSVSAFMRPHSEISGNWVVPGSWMHVDARRIKDLFKQHKNVKLCLSGHEHLHGKANYLGVTYKSTGAVCGAWWKGDFEDSEPGYTTVDLFPDGTFKTKYHPWGWKAIA